MQGQHPLSNINVKSYLKLPTYYHVTNVPLYLPDVSLEISLLYLATHGKECIQIEKVWICTVSNLMVLECPLQTTNVINIIRLTWCTNSTLHNIEHLGSWPLSNANDSLFLTYCQKPRPQ